MRAYPRTGPSPCAPAPGRCRSRGCRRARCPRRRRCRHGRCPDPSRHRAWPGRRIEAHPRLERAPLRREERSSCSSAAPSRPGALGGPRCPGRVPSPCPFLCPSAWSGVPAECRVPPHGSLHPARQRSSERPRWTRGREFPPGLRGSARVWVGAPASAWAWASVQACRLGVAAIWKVAGRSAPGSAVGLRPGGTCRRPVQARRGGTALRTPALGSSAEATRAEQSPSVRGHVQSRTKPAFRLQRRWLPSSARRLGRARKFPSCFSPGLSIPLSRDVSARGEEDLKGSRG